VDPGRELRTGQRRANGRNNRPDTRKHLNYTHHPFRDSSCIHWGVHTRTFGPPLGQASAMARNSVRQSPTR
jgi:hypothetical protein